MSRHWALVQELGSALRRTQAGLRKIISTPASLLTLAAVAVVGPCGSPAFAALKFVEAQKNGVGGVVDLAGVNQAVVSSDGKHVYAAAENDNAVVVFSRNAATGQLAFVEAQQDGVGGVDGLTEAYSLTVSGDGKHVYVASEEGAVAVFSRNATTGQLTFVEAQKNGVGGVDGLLGAAWLTLSPDDKHLYVCGFNDNALAVFSRNTTTGQLTFVEVQRDGVGGVDGLAAARSVFVSPDGKHVYVAGALDNAVAVFSRNATTGQLTFVEVQKYGVGGVVGIGTAFGVTVSPDGRNVYVAGLTSHAVAVFGRNQTTGALNFVEALTDDIGGVDGLFGAASVVVSPDGTRVYATGDLDDAVVVFLRDSLTGELTFVEALKDGVGGIDGLDGANSVSLSPGGEHVYVAGAADSAVAVFVNSCGDGTVDVGEQCDDGNTVSGDCCSASCQIEAATCRAILGKRVQVRDRRPGVDASKRSIKFSAIEKDTVEAIVGNPLTDGATLLISMEGATPTSQSFTLPAGALWTALSGGSGFVYADPNFTASPVKSVLIQKILSGTFTLKVEVSAKSLPLSVVPPNPGTVAGMKLTIHAGNAYCAKLGGPAGGVISSSGNTNKQFKVTSTKSSPASKAGCP